MESLRRQYSASVATDMSEAERVEEVVREQLFQHLHQEVPFLTRQENRVWEVLPDGVLHIQQDIQVPSKRHARMLTARGAAPLKIIARASVKELENIFGCRVKLGLHVAVKARVAPEQ